MREGLVMSLMASAQRIIETPNMPAIDYTILTKRMNGCRAWISNSLAANRRR
jgi:hypothetical protein